MYFILYEIFYSAPILRSSRIEGRTLIDVRNSFSFGDSLTTTTTLYILTINSSFDNNLMENSTKKNRCWCQGLIKHWYLYSMPCIIFLLVHVLLTPFRGLIIRSSQSAITSIKNNELENISLMKYNNYVLNNHLIDSS
jgi:hypothetical protein